MEKINKVKPKRSLNSYMEFVQFVRKTFNIPFNKNNLKKFSELIGKYYNPLKEKALKNNTKVSLADLKAVLKADTEAEKKFSALK